MTQHLILVLSNAKPDRDEKFNTWHKTSTYSTPSISSTVLPRRSFSCSPTFQRPRSFPIGT